MNSDSFPEDILKTNLPLLEHTQEYLQSLSGKQTPDPILLEAWQEFYEVYSNLIRRFIISRGLRGADVDDCVQEVWSAVARSLASFEHPGDRPGLRSWLYTVVRSKASDLIRRKTRQPQVSLGDAVHRGNEPSDLQADPATLYERQWDYMLVQTTLEEMRPNVTDTNYRVLHMRMIEGREVQDVATALKLTPDQVRYRQHRTLRKLRKKLSHITGQVFVDDSN